MSKKPTGASWSMWALAVVVLLAVLAATFALIPARRASASSQTARNPCAVHIPVHGLPHRVTVYRDGRPVPPHPGMYLQRNDKIRVGVHRTFVFSYGGNSYRIHTGLVRLSCRRLRLSLHQSRRRVLAVGLDFGLVHVMHAGHHPRTAAVVTPEMVAAALAHGNRFDVRRNSRHKRTLAWTATRSILVWEPGHANLRVNTRHTYTAISDSRGLRLNVWPFAISARQRHTRPGDRLVPFWADGRECSVGCTPAGVRPGWPLKPFHQQHTIRSALNELRPPSSFHVALDIDASNGQPVYAIQSGHVNIRYLGTPDVNVDVGRFYYWHIHPAVHDGQYVRAYKTVLGNVLYGFKHVAFSEIGPQGQYLNPLRPGRSLRPYTDTAPPIIGTPRVFSDGRVFVAAFDPQSHIDYHSSYLTPVLAPAALAWRLYDASNHAVTGLNWALRGSQLYPPSLVPRVFAPGAKNPGFDCFYTQRVCIPHWIYWLAGGLTPRLPLSSLRAGRYRLTVYAWDWAGNTSALDYWVKVPFAGPRAPSGHPIANFDYP